MKTKDRSYIELISITITALLIIMSITLIITNYFKKERIKKYNDYEMLITESTYKYLDNHKDIVDKLKKDYAYINLKVEDLVKDSYLSDDIENPKTKKSALNDKIGITLDEYENISVTYPSKYDSGLFTKNIIKNLSNKSLSLKDILNTTSLAFTYDGKIINNYLTIENTKLKEEYNLDEIGLYEITYIFKEKEYKTNVIVVDDKAPVITDITYNKEKYQNSIRVSANISDEDSGLASYSISKNCKNYQNVTDNKIEGEINENGKWYICVKDLSGNMTKEEINITNIDNTAPEINISEFDETNKIIKGEITDEESGVVAYAVTKTVSKPTSWIIIENTKKFDKLNYQITKKGTYYIWAKDASGNTSRSKAIDLNWVN
ncbi:MAG: hypothetical protein Q4C33_03915 [bacterium]|nr:hypothetical protein [bacterium]